MRVSLFLGCFLCVPSLFAWNAEGHRVVAEIAFEHMTPSAKARFQVAHPVLDAEKGAASFTEGAVWFDTLRSKQLKAMSSMHYVDLPIFSDEKTTFKRPKANALHALMAYSESRQRLLEGTGNALEQVIALRILLHVTADLHQPLHAATRITRKYPEGDAGGNKVHFPKNKVSRNLHTYWDRAGGFLSNRMSVSLRAHVVETIWPCDLETVDKEPIHWLAESHVLAEQKVYTFNHKKGLDTAYQKMVYDISQKRLAEAGCRLAAVLNEIDTYGFPVVG
ncbi:MAG: S1/P1 nuclease [Gammaproteobacteria bacterium]|nr:S1/P1 nuclease [Gammaproteobacteria bacterium]